MDQQVAEVVEYLKCCWDNTSKNRYYQPISVLVGSRAAQIHFPEIQVSPNSDWDIVSSADIIIKWLEANKSNIVEIEHSKDHGTVLVVYQNEGAERIKIDITLAKHQGDLQAQLVEQNARSFPIITPFTMPVRVCEVARLIHLKRSHLYYPTKWELHIFKYHELLKYFDSIFDKSTESFKQLAKTEHENLFGKLNEDPAIPLNYYSLLCIASNENTKPEITDELLRTILAEFKNPETIEGDVWEKSDRKVKKYLIVQACLSFARVGFPPLDIIKTFATNTDLPIWFRDFVIDSFPSIFTLFDNVSKQNILEKKLEKKFKKYSEAAPPVASVLFDPKDIDCSEQLPNEILLEIFNHFDDFYDLLHCSLVRKSWQALIDANWQYFYLTRWKREKLSFYESLDASFNWKKLYFENCQNYDFTKAKQRCKKSQSELEVLLSTNKYYKTAVSHIKKSKGIQFESPIHLIASTWFKFLRFSKNYSHTMDIPTWQSLIPLIPPIFNVLFERTFLYNCKTEISSEHALYEYEVAIYDLLPNLEPLTLSIKYISGAYGNSRWEITRHVVAISCGSHLLLDYDAPALYGYSIGYSSLYTASTEPPAFSLNPIKVKNYPALGQLQITYGALSSFCFLLLPPPIQAKFLTYVRASVSQIINAH